MTSSSMQTEPFDRRIDRWVRHALAHGCTSLDQIIGALPGVYPSIVRDSIRRLASHGHGSVRLDTVQEVLWPTPSAGVSHTIALPIPHPLDYDWRFSDAAVAYLLRTSAALAAPGATIALLGTPSIMRAVIEEPPPYQFVLVEANSAITTCLAAAAPTARIVQSDIGRDRLPDLTAAVIIADPPWYKEYIRSFLWAACRLCQINGTILMSVPPVGTRPGIALEWERTLLWAEQLGLALVRLEPNAIEYRTPPFERNALRAEGLGTLSPYWRQGNLAIFMRQDVRRVRRPPLPAHDGQWEEVQVDGVRIRLRRRVVGGFSDPLLIPLVSGHVLSSVSRRDPRRQQADVWTSGNRIFACRGTALLTTIIRSIASGQSSVAAIQEQIERPLIMAEQSLVACAIRQMTRLIAHEQRDALHFGEGTVHDESEYLAARRSPSSRSG